jgi:hypothetical protein
MLGTELVRRAPVLSIFSVRNALTPSRFTRVCSPPAQTNRFR